MNSCAICKGEISDSNAEVLLDNVEICNVCEFKLDKIYPGFFLNSRQFSIHQAKRLLKKGSDVHQFKTEIFKINPNLPDYSGVVLWGIFEMIQYEKLMHIVFGKHEQRGYGTLISTDKRLIFIDAGIDEVLFKESISLEDINSINFSPSNNIITIVIPQKTIEIELDHPQSGIPFCEVVHQLIGRSKKMEIPDISIILDLVERLGTLKQEGILTDEEFSQEKAKLFSKL